MTRLVRSLCIVTTLVLLTASAAFAVTGNLEVTASQTGKPLSGAKISLRSIDTGNTVTTAETDDSGKATIAVEEGTYTIQVGEGDERMEQTITIRGGETSTVNFDLPDVAPPPFKVPPAGGIFYGDEQADDFPLTSSEDRITDIINGQEQATNVEPNDPDDLNNNFDWELDWNQFSATFGFGIADSENVHPSVHVTVGRVDVSFRNNNLIVPSSTNTFEGDGFVFGAGLDVLFSQGDFFAGPGYNFVGYYDVDLSRQRVLFVPGGEVLTDEIQISYYSHQIRGVAGYRVGVFYPYGGVAFWIREMTIEGRTEVDFSELAGIPFVRRQEFTNEFEDNEAAALVGAMIRAGHFIAGVEATFGSNFTTVSLNAGIAF